MNDIGSGSVTFLKHFNFEKKNSNLKARNYKLKNHNFDTTAMQSLPAMGTVSDIDPSSEIPDIILIVSSTLT